MSFRPFSTATHRRVGKGLIALAICLVLVAVWRWFIESKFLRSATLVAGQIASVTVKRNLHHPEVVFYDLAGHSYKMTPLVKTSFRDYKVGEDIDVLFEPGNPTDAKLNEPMQIWATTHLFLYLSALCAVLGLCALFVPRRKR